MKYCPRCGVELRERNVEGVNRLTCSGIACTFVYWDNPTPVVAGIVRWRGGFVFARNADWPAGTFSMITGFVERNETPEQALRREIKEELGLDLEAWAFIGHYPFLEANHLIIALLADSAGELVLGDEIAEVKVMTPSELADYDFGQLALTATVVRDSMRLASNPTLHVIGAGVPGSVGR